MRSKDSLPVVATRFSRGDLFGFSIESHSVLMSRAPGISWSYYVKEQIARQVWMWNRKVAPQQQQCRFFLFGLPELCPWNCQSTTRGTLQCLSAKWHRLACKCWTFATIDRSQIAIAAFGQQQQKLCALERHIEDRRSWQENHQPLQDIEPKFFGIDIDWYWYWWCLILIWILNEMIWLI